MALPGLIPPDALLCGRAGAPWLEGEDGSTLSRRQARGLLLRRAEQWRGAGLRPGRRLAWLPAPEAEAVLTALAALEAGASLVLAPLRETPERRAEQLALLAPAGLFTRDVVALPEGGPDSGDPPASVWLRSSGSLGRPRWLRHRLGGLLEGARAAAARLGLEPPMRWWASLPLDHVGGLGIVLRCLVSGCRLGLPRRGLPGRWEPGDWLSLVPTQLHDLLEAGRTPGGLAGVLLGGAPLPETLRRRALREGWPLWTSYGASETGALVCCGRARPAAEADSGRPFAPHRLSLDGAGRILVAGPSLADAELDASGRPAPCEGGVWASGDLGLWRRGRLEVRGRMDRVLVSGGEKVPAEELERLVLALPGVRRAAVVELEDPRWGQRPALFVEADEPAGIPALLAARLPAHWRPLAVWPWPDDAPEGWKTPLAWLTKRAALWWSGGQRGL